LICAWLKLASRGVDGLYMQRFVTGVLVVLAVALSAGGVAVTGRADSNSAKAAAPAAAPQDQCAMPARQPIHLNGEAVENAVKDDVVPLNAQGYNYDAYDDQWRPQIKAGPAPAAPAAPEKP
jgi:hypothetical protein